MNLNLFDDIDGLVLRERESVLTETDQERKRPVSADATSRFPQNTPLAMAYVPFQQWGETYQHDDALEYGTLFPELNFPFRKGERS
ncbi:spore coat associated protein CotJA [Ruminococcus sp. XPD3002]|uniref:spore coat associated protein CotJA n=1 Tax=Ruminococcus sp. XPD3002 TaxID=1452269 RepID=UPI0009140B46|nr:Spore coat associated protein JA (CotJA) [Ruminococcus flavefaciens]HPY86260.1 spore coat associated protein CotJA [Ruminococcus flavefaciens]